MIYVTNNMHLCSYLVIAIVLFCLVIPVSAVGKWTLNDTKVEKLKDFDYTDTTKETFTMTETSFTHTTIFHYNTGGGYWKATGTWELPPQSLVPGETIRMKGQITKDSENPECAGWDQMNAQFSYGLEYNDEISRISFKDIAAVQSTRDHPNAPSSAIWDAEIIVPDESYRQTGVILTVLTSGGRCYYYYTYTTDNQMENHPPTVTLDYLPQNPTEADDITLKANALDPDGDQLTYSWFMDDIEIGYESGTELHRHLEPDDYEYTVKVSDGKGGIAQATVRFTVIKNTPAPSCDELICDLNDGLNSAVIAKVVDVCDHDPLLGADLDIRIFHEWDEKLKKSISGEYVDLPQMKTDGNGEATIPVTGNPGDIYRVEVHASNGEDWDTSDCSIYATIGSEATLTGIKGDVLEVVSLDQIPDANVTATNLETGAVNSVMTNSDGTYSISVPPGHYSVQASAPGYLTSTGTFGDDVRVRSPQEEPYPIDGYTTFPFRMVSDVDRESSTKSFEFDSWGYYKFINISGKTYLAAYLEDPIPEMIDGGQSIPFLWQESNDRDLQKNGEISEVLVDDCEERTVTSGTPLVLEEGYELAITSIDTDGKKVYLELSKDGQVVDSKLIKPFPEFESIEDRTYCYRSDVGRTKKVVQIAVYFKNAFQGGSGMDLATVGGVFQISDSPIDISGR
jgi:S-layer protein (TIGR01567 family)